MLCNIKKHLRYWWKRNFYGVIEISQSCQYFIPLWFTPREVWIDLGSPCDIPVCNGEQDLFDVQIIPNGFIITAKINSEYRKIKWKAIR